MNDDEKLDEYSKPIFFLMVLTGVLVLGFAAWSAMR